jgi:hypothetical protein
LKKLIDFTINSFVTDYNRCCGWRQTVNVLNFCLFSIFLMCGMLHGEPMHNKLSQLQAGDEIVFDFHQSITVIGIVDTSEHTVLLRIATATKDILSRENFSTWLQWFQKGAPGALTDETLSIRMDLPAVQHASRNQRVQWLLTLLRLELTKIPDSGRRRVGPAPNNGEIDLRPLFQPRIVIHEKASESKSDAFSTQWPADESELSSRLLILYFPQSPYAVQAFPYWIESPSSSYHVSVIDSIRSSSP